jgi:hypothetical protein
MPLPPPTQIASVCAARGWWMHVDGAYGGAGVFAPSVRTLYNGLQHADRWGSTAGCDASIFALCLGLVPSQEHRVSLRTRLGWENEGCGNIASKPCSCPVLGPSAAAWVLKFCGLCPLNLRAASRWTHTSGSSPGLMPVHCCTCTTHTLPACTLPYHFFGHRRGP